MKNISKKINRYNNNKLLNIKQIQKYQSDFNIEI